jgi:hypothetical protein
VTARDLRIIWREALCESSVDSTAKFVGLAISLRMNSEGFCYPGRELIAAYSSFSVRTIELAVTRLDAAGWLYVKRSKGRVANRYYARLPQTANEVRRSEWATAKLPTFNREAHAVNGEAASPEVVVRGPKRVAGDLSTDDPSVVPLDYCGRCGRKRPLPDDIYCDECLQLLCEGVEGE